MMNMTELLSQINANAIEKFDSSQLDLQSLPRDKSVHFARYGRADVNCMVFFPENRVVLGTWGNGLQIWNYKTNEFIGYLGEANTNIFALEKYLDKYVIAGHAGDSRGYLIEIWDIENGTLFKSLKGHEHSLHSFVLLNNQTLASTATDRTIKIWDIEAEKCLNTVSVMSTDGQPTLIKMGNKLLIATCEGNIEIYMADSSCRYLDKIAVDSRYAHCMAQLSDTLFASGGDDGVKIWDINTKRCVKVLDSGKSIYSIAYHESEQLLLSGNMAANPHVCGWKYPNFERVVHQPSPGDIRIIKFLPNTDDYILGTGGEGAIIYDRNMNWLPVLEAIIGNTSLKELTLADKFCLDATLFDKLLNIVQTNQGLQKIHLPTTDISQEHENRLETALANHPTLELIEFKNKSFEKKPKPTQEIEPQQLSTNTNAAVSTEVSPIETTTKLRTTSNQPKVAELLQMFQPKERNIVINKKEIEKSEPIGEKADFSEKMNFFESLNKNQL